MIRHIRGAWALFLASAMVMVGHGLNQSHLGVRGSMEGLSSTSLGYVFAAFALGFLVSTRITPRLLVHVGHVRVYAAYVAGASVSALLYGAIIDPIAWGIFRFFGGLCMSGIFVVSESWLNGVIGSRDRGKILSLYVMTQLLGLIGGQALLQIGPIEGYGLFVAASAMISLSCIPMLLSTSPTPAFRMGSGLSLRELFRVSPLGSAGIFFIGMAFAVAYQMGPVFGASVGLTVSEVAIFISTIYVGGTLSQYPVGWLSDRLDRRHVAMGLSACAAAVSFGAWALAPGPYVLVAIAATFGVTIPPMYALLVAHANDFVDADRAPSVSAGLMFMQGIGAATGPIVAGFAMTGAGPFGYFLVLGTAASGILVFAAYRSRIRPAAARGEGSPFVAMPLKAGEVAAEIYGEEARRAKDEYQNPPSAPR